MAKDGNESPHSSPDDEGVHSGVVAGHMEAQALSAQERRMRVVSVASQMLRVLRGDEEDAHPLVSGPPEGLSPAPEQIPSVSYTAHMHLGGQDFPQELQVSLGQYFARHFPDLPPSDVFHIAYYAAGLAAREGLMDTSGFLTFDEIVSRDQEPPLPDPGED
jgi:hypothetical protein